MSRLVLIVKQRNCCEDSGHVMRKPLVLFVVDSEGKPLQTKNKTSPLQWVGIYLFAYVQREKQGRPNLEQGSLNRGSSFCVPSKPLWATT